MRFRCDRTVCSERGTVRGLRTAASDRGGHCSQRIFLVAPVWSKILVRHKLRGYRWRHVALAHFGIPNVSNTSEKIFPVMRRVLKSLDSREAGNGSLGRRPR
jgi:hypothetical protein